MSCTRCQGRMLEEQMIDMEASYGEVWVCAQRRVNCGYRQGLEQFRAYPVDLVLTDLEMPEMNGLDVIKELTRTGLDVKIIAMSGVDSEELKKAKLYGARQIFPNPLTS